MRIKMLPVNSVAIKSIGYLADSGRLGVRFYNGKRYTFINVPEKTANEFFNAASVGAYFVKNIKNKFTLLRKDL